MAGSDILVVLLARTLLLRTQNTLDSDRFVTIMDNHDIGSDSPRSCSSLPRP